MATQQNEKCKYQYTDKNRTVLVCAQHKDERYLLTPATKERILSEIRARGGEIEGEQLPSFFPEESSPESTQVSAVPATKLALSSDLVEYTAFEGAQVILTVQMFREMICPEANQNQAWYMLQWCVHNRIDPFANEAYFAVMSGKPVIQVSKDAWFKRMERHPQFDHHESGIVVETTLEHLRVSVVTGSDDYLISDALRTAISESFSRGQTRDLDKTLPPRFTAKKKSHYLDDKENLLGAWAVIYRKDRPQPYGFTVNKQGWETKTSQDNENVFWKNKAPFMIWKTALKNCVRLAFPELSGLLNAPEAREGMAELADAEFTTPNTNEQKKALFAEGKRVPAPIGPLPYPELHRLAGALYDGKGISELSIWEMSAFIDLVARAANGDEQFLKDIATVLAQSPAPKIAEAELIEGGTNGQ